jgi:hypothetical protein
MSITYKGVRDGGVTRDDSGYLRATRKLLYYFDAGETSLDAYAQAEVPAHGAAHPTYTSMQCIEVSVESNGGRERGTYEVSCVYSSESSLTASSGVDPWDQPVTNWYLGPVDNTKPFEFYYKDGVESSKKPLLTSAGTPIAALMNDPHLIMRFTWNVREFKDEWICEYYNSMNNRQETVAGIEIKTGYGLLKALSGRQLEVYDDDGSLKYSYAQCDVEIEITSRGWGRQFVDRSRWFLSNGKQARIWTCMDASGNPHYGSEAAMKTLAKVPAQVALGIQAHAVDEEQLLDGKGNIKYPSGIPATGPVVSYAPLINSEEIKAYDKLFKDWSSLGLPLERGVSRAVYTGSLK